ncbi:MAG: hypothetical protein NT164_02320 [Verrucomicrobiae bacterium]|nr:hypothetical protein [Verrucomicrobiae bacterium]
MKLTGPFNQLRSFLPSIVGASGYRFLCIFMAALLFCGMNSQVMAASVPLGANNAPASGDQFNSESFLKASNPNADDNQQLTWGEKIGAGILGVALLGGAVAGGYKCYANLKKVQAGGNGFESISSHGDDSSNSARGGSANVKEIQIETLKGDGDQGFFAPAEQTLVLKQKASESLDCLRAGALMLGQGAYDLVTLKSCRSAASAEELAAKKPLMNHLKEFLTAQLKEELAAQLLQRPFLVKIYDLVALTQHALPSHQTERQKNYEAMEALGKRLATQLTASEKYEKYLPHLNAKNKRAADIEALNPENSIDAILATLDTEMKEAIGEALQKYAGDNDELGKAFAYFIAKNQDEWHPGHLLALNTAFDNMENDLTAEIIVNKMHEAVQARWYQDNKIAMSK